MLQSNDRNKNVVNEPEMCYSLVKVLRDHGAERKLWHDKIRISMRAEKLSKRTMDREANSNFAGRCRNKSAIKGRKFDIPPQKKHKSSISPWKSPTSQVLCAELATTVEVLSSARPVSVLALRGDMKDGLLDDQHSTGAINLVSEGAAQSPNKANIQVHPHSPVCQERPPKIPYGSVGAPKSSPPPAICNGLPKGTIVLLTAVSLLISSLKRLSTAHLEHQEAVKTSSVLLIAPWNSLEANPIRKYSDCSDRVSK